MKVEKGVPMPEKRISKFRGRAATIREMDFGDSVIIDEADLHKWRFTAYDQNKGTRSQKLGDGKVRMWIIPVRNRQKD